MNALEVYEDSIRYFLIRPLEFVLPLLGAFINNEGEEDGLTIFERIILNTPELPWIRTVVERDQTLLCMIHTHEAHGYLQKNLENILFVAVERDYLLCYAHILTTYEFYDHTYEVALGLAPSLSVANIVMHYQHRTKRLRMLRFSGLFRCFPMLMLWRKRVVEKMYHPSNINFYVNDTTDKEFITQQK